jgi:hypothetical protein
MCAIDSQIRPSIMPCNLPTCAQMVRLDHYLAQVDVALLDTSSNYFDTSL